MLPRPRHSQRGVALVITVVMLSVITFLTVAFLALMGREKGSVKTAVDQSTARFAADTALERAKAELLAGILASTNLANFGPLVSTNFFNPNGFDPDPTVFDQYTNVNYEYRISGAPLGFGAANQYAGERNLTNQFINPRPPVFITNRLLANSTEFRYYIDSNRNGRHDRTGLWPETNALGLPITVLSNSILVTNFSYNTGDPEWIGLVDRADRSHGPDNKFLSRIAFFVVPTGKTLDVNYIHNQAVTKALNPAEDGFARNEGFGPWEINLAAFLADLNTNQWNPNPNPPVPTYRYQQPQGFGNVGVAFDDARSFLAHRYANNYGNLLSVAALYPGNGMNAFPAAPIFRTDNIDGYADFPLLQGPTNLDETIAGALDNPDLPWSGADNPNHFFSMQDIFDPTKTSPFFTNRLLTASTNVSTYDQYTFSRMASQLGTDSAPEDPDKLHLTYVNVGPLSATNFIRWTDVSGSVLFFTNAVDRLLKAYTEEWLAADYAVYTNIFKTDQPFGVTQIPVFVSDQFIYPPAVHRILQMAANIWDAQTNRTDVFGAVPTKFQPLFSVSNNNVYITSFREVSRVTELQTAPRPPVDLTASTNLPSIAADELLYGVPLVVGARKGLPNFNEFAMESTFVLTRKLELRKSAPGGWDTINQTNQFFTLALTMPSAAEFWNSYAANYTRPVDIFVTNRTTMRLTNDLGVDITSTFVFGERISTNNWTRFQDQNVITPKSFFTGIRSNVSFLPLVGYIPLVGFVSATNESLFDTSQALLTPRWGMTITNRVHAMILEQGTGRIIDYVLLGNLTSYRNLTEEFSNPATGTGDPFAQLWATNGLSSGRLTGRMGVLQQINVSRGANAGVDLTDNRWRSFGTFTPNNVNNAVADFNTFFQAGNTDLQKTVPFSPSVVFSVPMIWQANDPLVHYLAGELFNIEESGQVIKTEPPLLTITTNALVNIGKKNKRYKPWASSPDALDTDPDAFNTSIKDPLVRSSDEWQFPTNVLPTLGWLGRIHRGTPWQTIYLKASNVGLTNIVFSPTEWRTGAYRTTAEKWGKWSGNNTFDYEACYYTRPVADRVLFDVFTTALNDNAARGRLPINQPGLASWSALFSGMVALTNNSPVVNASSPLPPQFGPYVIEPAGIYNATNPVTWPPLVKMVDGINRMRANTNFFRNGTFEHLGDILAVPELTDASPFLNRGNNFALQRGLSDVAYEWLPQQMLSLLQLGEPRFVIYAYGQSLQPAPNSIITSGGDFLGLCTNYTITAEVAMRAVVRVEGSPNPNDVNHPNPKKRYPPRIVTESFNFLPPE